MEREEGGFGDGKGLRWMRSDERFRGKEGGREGEGEDGQLNGIR